LSHAEAPPPEAADLLQRAAPDIAHDLNNLRAVVQGNLRLVRQEAKACGQERMEEPLADVDLGFQLMVAQVQGVLALARGAPARSPSPHPLPAVLGKIEPLARWALPPQFRILLPPQPPELMVPADPDLLQAALLKLVLLAKDAAPEGGAVQISVKDSAGAEDPQQMRVKGRHVQLRVEIPGTLPEAGAPPPRGKFAVRLEVALALARRATAPSGDVLLGSKPEGPSFFCLLLPLATPD
jgi:signal transduction histidine kinase